MKKNKTERPILDIAILTAGRVDLFEKCIDALLPEMQSNYRIQVFNNGHPSPAYEAQYKRLPENSTIKRGNHNIGFGGGANSVINCGNSPLVLFVSDDIFVHSGAIQTLLETMNTEPAIGLCGYKFLFPADSDDPNRPAGKVQHVGVASTIRGDMVHPLMGWNPEHPKCNISREVLAVTGASFMVRRQLFQKAGGFNPIYGLGYFEDMDLCFTMRFKLGYKVYINTEAVATHGVAQTMQAEKSTPIQQNQMIFKSTWVKSMPWSDWEIW